MGLIDARAPKPSPRGAYKKQTSNWDTTLAFIGRLVGIDMIFAGAAPHRLGSERLQGSEGP
ncbi:hypothetical protein [Albidovulum aquaemixtae]|uniref:hypothetical protein n=1 Tax=Albidovulum aquaemixtae TaxID=1542388 RepID=UPI0011B29E7E|nr:hypothetical protein [Defluviimonas aquaemixtae]